MYIKCFLFNIFVGKKLKNCPVKINILTCHDYFKKNYPMKYVFDRSCRNERKISTVYNHKTAVALVKKIQEKADMFSSQPK